MAAVAIGVVFAIAGAAFADTITSDGDTVTAGNNTTVSLGTVSPGATLHPTVRFFLNCASSKHADQGQTVTLAFSAGGSSASGGSVSATGGSVGPVPSSWPDDTTGASNCGSATSLSSGTLGSDSTVTIGAPTAPGSYTYIVAYTASLAPAGTNDPASVAGSVPSVTYTLTVPAPSDTTPPSISYVLNPASPDGSGGWYKSDVTLTWTVTDNESSLVKTGCVDQNITADQASTDYSCSATSAGGSTGPVTVSIKRDASAPSVSGSPHSAPDGDNGWYKSNVTIDWTCSDNGPSGLAVADTCTSTTTITSEGADLTDSLGPIHDNAGNATTGVSSPAVSIDKTDPSISVSHTADGSNDWNVTAPVSLTITASDGGGSGLAAKPTCTDGAASLAVSGTSSPYGASVSGQGTHNISCSVSDAAGNSNSDTDTVMIDTVAPSVSGSPTTSANGAGWYKTNVTIHWTCSDATSHLAGSCPSDSTISSEGTGLTASSGAVLDNAGNSTTATSSPAVSIDKTAPGLNWSGGPADGSSYYFGSVPAAPTCTATDSGSGPNGCSVTGYSTLVGNHTLTATAHDVAGNETQETRSYTVQAWTLNGFYQPVDMSTTTTTIWNTVKNGSTVPFKFEIFSGSTELTNTSAVTGFSADTQTCPNGNVTTDEIEVTATGGTSLRYDTTAGQYVYNWQTPKKQGNCYKVTMTTQDGSTLSALFILK
jgi:hypothetical protein